MRGTCFGALVATCSIALLSQSAYAQPKTLVVKPRETPALFREAFAVRVQGGIALTTYSATFNSSHDIIDCGQLEYGNGAGAALNAILELRAADMWGIGLGVGYSGRAGQFKRTNAYPVRDTLTNTDGVLTTTASLEPDIAFLELQADARIALLGKYETRSLGLVIGPRIALPLHTRFTQFETVVSPSNATFLVDGQRTQQRTVASGVLSTRAYALFGVSASLESFISLSNKVALVPQLSFDYFFNSMLTDADWKLLGVRAEIGVRFGITSPAPKPPPVIAATPTPRPDPIPPPPPVAVDQRPPVIELQPPTYRAEFVSGDELLATSPIVNAVFFDSTSSDIPKNYRIRNDGSRPSTDPVQAHSWVLVRIADILARNPQGTIILQGATSGADEAEGLQLAERRAQIVQKAFVQLGVDPSRIKTRAAITPRIPSNPEYIGGREENRRVDIVVENAPLQEWVTVQQFSDVQGMMSVNAIPVNVPGSTMRIKVGNHDTTIQKSQGEVSIPFTAPIPVGANSSRVRVTAEADGAFSEAIVTIDTTNLVRRQIDLKTTNFEAVLRFDYNSSDLNDDIRALLRQLSERLPASSAITIYGSADVLGTDLRNKELSTQRASVTEQYIRSLVGNKFTIETSTSGQRFADLTPQGRFLNRSIRITVRTK